MCSCPSLWVCFGALYPLFILSAVCNVDSMLFFPMASAENYVTFSLTLPDLHELSVCLWLRVEAQHIGTLLSYATDDNDNQLVLYGHDPVYRRLPVWSLLDARWHHLCILWSSIQGRFWHYSDQHLISSGSNFRKGWEVPGGGSLVLGQEQDIVAGGFDAAEGFAGQVAGFRVWKRVLTPAEVEGMSLRLKNLAVSGNMLSGLNVSQPQPHVCTGRVRYCRA
uniref:Pentraxin family member n=1 Tax=Labrus bergylta TaxID=56723 RepID=A0A3Q3EKF2_9LABR